MAELKILQGPRSGEKIPLVEGGVLRIGRSPPAPARAAKPVVDLVIDDRKLSRLHCEVLEVEGAWVLRDCGSSNGTFLNGKRVHERVLRPGDRVQAGDLHLELQAAPGEEPAPSGGPRLAAAGPARGRARQERRSMGWAILAAIAAAGVIIFALFVVPVLRGKPSVPPSAARPAPAGTVPPDSPRDRAAGAPTAEPAMNVDVTTAVAGPKRVEGGAAAPPPGVVAAAVDGHLAAGEFREAIAYLEDMDLRGGGYDLEPLRRRVLEKASADLSAAAGAATRKTALGGDAGARSRLESLVLRLPDELAADGVAALQKLEALESSVAGEERGIESQSGKVRIEIGKLDFTEAARILDAIGGKKRERALETASAGDFLAPEEAFRAEIRSASAAWMALTAAIDRKPRPFRQSFEDASAARESEAGRAGPGTALTVSGREVDELLLESPPPTPPEGGRESPPPTPPEGGRRAGAKERTRPEAVRSIFEIDDAGLASLVVEGTADPKGKADLLEGMGILLFHRAGPARAQRFVNGLPGLAGDRKQSILRRVESAGEAWLPASLAAAAACAERLTGAGSKDRERWEALSRRIGRLAGEWRRSRGWARERKAVADLFVKAKVRSLEVGGTFGLAASRVERKGSRLVLAYDFKSEAQLADFRKGPDSSLRISGNALILQGECRLLDGEPFEETLAVKGKVPAGGYDPSGPNINVALFTSEKDRLRIPGRPPASLFIFLGGTSGPDPADYVLLALGYRAAVADYGGKAIEKLYVNGATDPIDLPANAVIFAERGQPLHSDSRECPWASRATGLEGAVSFEIAADPEALVWKVQGKDVTGGAEAVRERWLKKEGRRGSVTLFTGGRTVRFSSLEVEGEAEKWLGARLRKEALRAFQEFDPR